MKYLPKLLILAILLTTACKDRSLIRPGDSIEVAFEKAMGLYEDQKYNEAADAFETVTRLGRGSDYAQAAQFFLAESYYNAKRYLSSSAEYERFLTFYPRDERKVEVEFKRAMSYYHLSPRYRLDQRDTRRAIDLFRLFNNNYPDSEYVTESAQKIDELRNKLARKYFEAADFYNITENYEAAIVYYSITIDQYPESKWAEEALFSQIKAYLDYADNSIQSKQIERYEGAVEGYEKFIQLFPRSERRGAVERFKDNAERAITSLSEANNTSELSQSN